MFENIIDATMGYVGYKRTWTYEEYFREVKEKEMLERLSREAETLLQKIKYNKPLLKATTLLTALTMNSINVLAYTKGVEALPVAGNKLLNILQVFGYYVCVIMCIIEIIKSLISGDTKSISRIVVKYIIAFGSFYFLPWIFDLIRDIFS